LADGKLLTTAFFEPSTRTRCSFEAAMQRMGGTVLSLSDMKRSSVSKGETLEDTMKCLGQYSDVLVVRHPEKGTPDRVMRAVPDLPVLNAGDGSGEHPTQALLDVFTIWKARGQSLDHITITFVGDLRFGRTVHSLVPALSLFEGLSIHFVAPPTLRIPSHIEDDLRDKGVAFKVLETLSDAVLAATDVLYVTRIQKERFESLESYQAVRGCFVVDAEVLSKCRSDLIVLHPLPRVDEIAVEVDDDPRALYFQQMQNGMFLRMALLALVLGVY